MNATPRVALLVCSLAVGVGAVVQTSVDKTGESSCAALLKALDMPPIKRPVARDKRGEITTIQWGDQICSYDARGKARAAVDVTLMQPPKGVPPKLKEPNAVLQVARVKAALAGFSLREPELSPSGPWGFEPGVVMIATQGRAYGQPTHGFAGGLRMQINRVSGKVASLAWTPEFTVDKPNVRVTKEAVLKLAEGALKRKKEVGRDYVSNALLQYFRPSPVRAAPEGKRMLAAKRLRFCWVVTLSMGKKLTDMSAPVASVAFDAETGKQISLP